MMTATTVNANLASRCVHSSSSRHPARGLMMKNTTIRRRGIRKIIWHSEDTRLLGYRSSPLPNNVITRAQSEADTSTSSFSSASLREGEGGGGTTKSSKITKLTSPVSKDQFVNFFRMALPYITMHKSATFVIHIPGNVMKDKNRTCLNRSCKISLS